MALADSPVAVPTVEPYQAGEDEEYMNEAQKEHFRQLLLQWRGQLMEGVERTVTHMQGGSSNHPDPTDRATQEEEFAIELRTRDRERKLLRKIDATLALIDNDDYGYCDTCGSEIGLGRLEARPTATLCIECKTLQELKEKRQGR